MLPPASLESIALCSLEGSKPTTMWSDGAKSAVALEVVTTASKLRSKCSSSMPYIYGRAWGQPHTLSTMAA